MGNIGFYFHGHFIAYYGLMITIGLLVACLIAYIQIRKHALNWNDFILLVSASGLGIVIGSKILYIAISIPIIDINRLNEFSYINSLMSGGFVFYGGVFGGLFSLYMCNKILKINIGSYLQHCTVCIPIAHGFGRIGCFLVGCCYGNPYDGLLSITYKHSLYAPNNIPVFPVQIVEAFGEFIIAIALLAPISKKWDGVTKFSFYILVYSAMRFILEFFRGDFNRGYVGILSLSQCIGIILFLISFRIFNLSHKKGSLMFLSDDGEVQNFRKK